MTQTNTGINPNQRLLLGSLPFHEITYHRIEHGSEKFDHRCLFFDAKEVKVEQVEDLLGQFAGLQEFKAYLKDLGTTNRRELFRTAVKAVTGQVADVVPRRLNMIIQGPSGTGKTTAAKVAGIYCVVNRLVSASKVVFVNALDVSASHVGDTKVVVNRLLEYSQGGVLIFDSAGSFAMPNGSSYSDEARTLLNDKMEEFNRDRGIVIFVDYPERIQQLLLYQSLNEMNL